MIRLYRIHRVMLKSATTQNKVVLFPIINHWSFDKMKYYFNKKKMANSPSYPWHMNEMEKCLFFASHHFRWIRWTILLKFLITFIYIFPIFLLFVLLFFFLLFQKQNNILLRLLLSLLQVLRWIWMTFCRFLCWTELFSFSFFELMCMTCSFYFLSTCYFHAWNYEIHIRTELVNVTNSSSWIRF